MWIGYSLHRQRWRQRVLDGAGRGRGVSPKDDGVWPGPGQLATLKIPSKPNCEWKTNSLKRSTAAVAPRGPGGDYLNIKIFGVSGELSLILNVATVRHFKVSNSIAMKICSKYNRTRPRFRVHNVKLIDVYCQFLKRQYYRAYECVFIIHKYKLKRNN